jgi:hypothetical protein
MRAAVILSHTLTLDGVLQFLTLRTASRLVKNNFSQDGPAYRYCLVNRMNGGRRLEIQVVGASLEEIKETLDLSENIRAGTEIPLPEGATLKIDDVSKSSGFDATTVILTAVISLMADASKEVLIAWLKSRLFKKAGPKPAVTILIDGKELQVGPGP